jgi:hypothetical protein
MKVSNHVERIFAHAVALDQRGGMRNTIYAEGDEIFIMNYDHTILLRFQLRKSEGKFDHPISFYANDYDSNIFEEVDGKIVFYNDVDGFKRKKICGKAKTTPEEIRALYKRYSKPKKGGAVEVTLGQGLLNVLEDKLSHVEFSAKKGKVIKMIQRNIYTGSVVEVTKKEGGFFKDSVPFSFGPVAIKTNDLQALYAFDEKAIKFTFLSSKGNDFVIVESPDKTKRNMSGIVACCLYDEVIEIEESKSESKEKKEKKDGRKVKKVRRG